jgi:RimJ/RimL family protein N-acetyltransferase
VELSAGPAIIRSWRPTDATELARQANDRRIWVHMRDAFPHPYSLEDAQHFIATALGMSPETYFAIAVAGAVAGGIGYTLRADVERVAAEVGYWLGAAYWGRGIATDAVRALTRHAFLSHQELRRLYAVPFSSNPASGRVLNKAGYRPEGTLHQSVVKDGQILDQWMYAIVRDEWERASAGPGDMPPGHRGPAT